MATCDTCGVRVSTKGFLGGSLVCKQCARDKRKGNVDALRERIERYGGGAEWEAKRDIQELLY